MQPFQPVMLSDNVNKVYYFESTLSPFILWVDLSKIDFKKGGTVKKLDLVGNSDDLAGNVNDRFIKAVPFKFAGPN